MSVSVQWITNTAAPLLSFILGWYYPTQTILRVHLIIYTVIQYASASSNIFFHIHVFHTFSICILVTVGLCYLDQLSLMPLGTSQNPLLSIKLRTSLSIKVDVITVPICYSLAQTLYLYLSFQRCIFSRQLILSHTILLLLVTVVMPVEFFQLFTLPQSSYQSTILLI